MNIAEAAQAMHKIIGQAMNVHNEYHSGLLESAYEAALCYVLQQDGINVQRQVFLPLYWHDVKLEQSYRLDMVVANEVIVELKAVKNIDVSHRVQLFNYMNITHLSYGMILNFGGSSLYSECYHRDHSTREIKRIFPGSINPSTNES